MSIATALLLAVLITPLSLADDGKNTCQLPEARRYPEMGRPMGMIIPIDWIEENADEIHEAFLPSCERYSQCLSVWGNSIEFCRDLLAIEVRAVCTSLWDSESERKDLNNCRSTAEVFAIAQNQQARQIWPELQRVGQASYEGRPIRAPRVELDPPSPRAGDSFDLVVRAFDADSGLPRYGLVIIDGRDKGLTFQRIGTRFQFDQVRDEHGRISFNIPSVTVMPAPVAGSGFPGFPEVTVSFSSTIRESKLTFDPPADRWAAGENTVRVTAVDSISGNAVVGSMMTPGRILGTVDGPVTFTLAESDEGLCGDPVWFRSQLMDHPDASLPFSPCK